MDEKRESEMRSSGGVDEKAMAVGDFRSDSATLCGDGGGAQSGFDESSTEAGGASFLLLLCDIGGVERFLSSPLVRYWRARRT